MKKILISFLSKNTLLSSMRLGSLLMIFSSCLYVISCFCLNYIITIFNIYCQHHYAMHAKAELLIIDWLGAATFAGTGLLGKTGQTWMEGKYNQQTNNSSQVKVQDNIEIKPGE